MMKKTLNHFMIIAGIILLQLLLSDVILAQSTDVTDDKNATFIEASANGDTETLKKMLKKNKTLVSISNARGSTPLMIASSLGHSDATKLLIEAGSEINAANNYGNTALHYAAWAADIESFKALYNKGAELFATNTHENTPFRYVLLGGNMDILRFIEANNEEAREKMETDSTLLLWAANGGNIEIFNHFLNKGFSLDMTDDNGSTILFWAVAGNNIEMIDFLVKEKGMDVNAENNGGHTPMHSALDWNRLEAAEYLLDNGVDPNKVFDDHRNWLHHVSQTTDTNLLKLFIEKGADVNAAGDHGERPLNWAAASGRFDNVRILVENGAKVNPGLCDRPGCDDNMSTPLHSAAYRNPAAIEYLIEKGAEVNLKDINGKTALHSAAMGDSINCVKLLLENGANVNEKDDKGSTPVHYAVSKGNTELMELLVKSGGDLNQADNKGNTALHYAATRGFGDLVKLMLENKADISVTNNNGDTPALLAYYYGNISIAEKLSNGKLPKKSKKVKSFKDIDIPEGDAMIWYCGHSGWAIKTKNHTLVFDYWQLHRQPDEICLNNGWVNPEELKNEDVYVFVSHSHQDHYDNRIFEWNDQFKDITYVMGFESAFPVDYTYIEPRNQQTVGNVKVTTIASNDTGEGFIVEVDGVKILHPGDHANKNDEMTEDYSAEIDFLAEKYPEVDIAFFPISGCGFQNKDAVYGGVYYGIEKLHPKIVLPMHGINREYEYQDFADKAKEKGYPVKFGCAANKGDRFYYNQSKATASK